MQEKKTTHIRKREIVHAALVVVGEKGVHGLTIAEIAGRAGMSDANIYRHFTGKAEILAALAEFIGEAVVGKAVRVAAGKRRAKDKLTTIFRSHVALIAANPGLPRFIFAEAAHHGDPQLAASIAAKMALYIDTLSQVIVAGCAAGDFRPGLAPRETAITFLGMIQFTAMRWSISHGAFRLQAEAEGLLANFTRLLLAETVRPGLVPERGR